MPRAVEGFSAVLNELNKPISGNTNTEALIAFAVRLFAEPFVYFVTGLGIIWWAKRGIDRAIAARKSADGNDASLELPAIEAILVAVLGLYFLCDGIIDLVATAGSVSFEVVLGAAPLGEANAQHLLGYGLGCLKIGIGIFLILRRTGFVTLRRRIPEWARGARRWRPFQGATLDG